MRTFLALLLVLRMATAQHLPAGSVAATGSIFTPAYVTSQNAGALHSGSGNTSITLTSTFNATSGTAIFCGLLNGGTSTTGVTGTGGDVFTLGPSQSGTQLWYNLNVTASATYNVVATSPSFGAFNGMACDQFSGFGAGHSIDISTTSTGTGTVMTSGSLATTAAAHELIYLYFAGTSASGHWTPGACGSGTCLAASNNISGVGVAIGTMYLPVTTTQTTPWTVSATMVGYSGLAYLNISTFK